MRARGKSGLKKFSSESLTLAAALVTKMAVTWNVLLALEENFPPSDQILGQEEKRTRREAMRDSM